MAMTAQPTMERNDLTNWNVLGTSDLSFLMKIRLVKFFGENGESAIMVTDEDEVYGIGVNNHGKLGTGSLNDCPILAPVRQLFGKRVKQVECGEMHSTCATEGGQVYCWGDNSQGQLGQWNITSSNSPLALPTLTTVVAITCGYSFTVALTRGNKVFAWGRNDVYQCGTNASAGVVVPSRVEFPEGLTVKAVAAGWGFSAALTNTGKVYCWGGNSFGQLGCPGGECRWRPVEVPGVSGVEAVAAGARHGLALGAGGTLTAWGSLLHPTDNPPAPRIVEGLPPVTGVTAVWRYSVSVAESERAIHMAGSFTSDGWKRVSYVVPGWEKGSGGDKLGPKPKMTGLFANRESVCLFCPVPSFNLTTRTPTLNTAQLFNQQDLSDITIEVGDKKIFCHKLILKLSCPHFKKILSDPWLKYNDRCLEVKDYSPHVYFDFIKYIYTKTLNFQDPMDLIEMWHIGVCYQYDGLRNDVVNNCKHALIIDNMAEFYQLAVKQRSSELEDLCLKMILQNFKEVTKTTGYKNLDGDTAKDLTLKWSGYCF